MTEIDLPLARHGAERLDGEDDALARRDVRHGEHLRLRRHRRREGLDDLVRFLHRRRHRHFLHHHAVALLPDVPPRPAPRVLLVGDQHLVARLQVEPVGHEVHRHRRVHREADLVEIAVDEVRELLAQPLLGAVSGQLLGLVRAVVPQHQALLDVAQVLGHRVHHHPRRRAQGAGIEERGALGDEELPAQVVPVGLAVGREFLEAGRVRGAGDARCRGDGGGNGQ